MSVDIPKIVFEALQKRAQTLQKHQLEMLEEVKGPYEGRIDHFISDQGIDVLLTHCSYAWEKGTPEAMRQNGGQYTWQLCGYRQEYPEITRTMARGNWHDSFEDAAVEGYLCAINWIHRKQEAKRKRQQARIRRGENTEIVKGSLQGFPDLKYKDEIKTNE